MEYGFIKKLHNIFALYFCSVMKKISINAHSANYQQEIIDLILSIQQVEFGIPITLESQPDLKNIPSFYQQDAGNFWIATIENKVAGTIALLDIGNSHGALRKMFVHKDYRGKEYGVGQTLLNTLLQWAGQNNFKEILLGTTEKFIAASRFYEKNGFTEIDKQLLPKEFPVMEVDVKFYRYRLNNN
jgi:N-acetylglutamate synthase-like GNAT family acetyltransferase